MRMPVSQPSLFKPSACYEDSVPRHLLILEYGRNPSTDYYVRPRCAAMDGVSCQVIDIAQTDPASVEIPPGTSVVIVRYVTCPWLRLLARNKARLTGVVYFMDDDLPCVLQNHALPIRYRYKILTLFLLQRRALSAICSEIRVSTHHLAEKYGLDRSSVLDPLPLAGDDGGGGIMTYFYEGTASHRAEFEWLREIVRRVQDRTTRLTFITVGGAEIRRIFAGIPRTLCLHPVSWPTYLESFPAIRHDIGLAPLLESSFNQARSHTKFFDITRYGAAGIYSDIPPYANFVRSGIDGLLVDSTPEAWSAAILELTCSDWRREIVANARQRVAAYRQQDFPSRTGPSSPQIF